MTQLAAAGGACMKHGAADTTPGLFSRQTPVQRGGGGGGWGVEPLQSIPGSFLCVQPLFCWQPKAARPATQKENPVLHFGEGTAPVPWPLELYDVMQFGALNSSPSLNPDLELCSQCSEQLSLVKP